MLRAAFNSVTRLHSREAVLKRLGDVDIFSPVRLTPSNYFRFLRGPEYTTVSGKEFIIPVDTLLGHFSQKIALSDTPTSGTFKLRYGSDVTGDLAYNISASSLQTALRLLTGMGNVVVLKSGNTYTVVFRGFNIKPELGMVESTTLDVGLVLSNSYEKWLPVLSKGDRILDNGSVVVVDEIIEMHDLGATLMGYRCRCD